MTKKSNDPWGRPTKIIKKKKKEKTNASFGKITKGMARNKTMADKNFVFWQIFSNI